MPPPRRFRRGGFRRGPRYGYPGPLVIEETYFDAPIELDDSLSQRAELDEASGVFPTFVLPADAVRYIDETDTGYDRLNTAILASPVAIDPAWKTSWGIQFAGWKTFATGARASVGFLNTTAVMDQTDRWAQGLVTWRDAFAKLGGQAPAMTPPGQGTPSSASLGDVTTLVVALGAAAALFIFGPQLRKG